MRCAAYVRVSTQEQATKGASAPAQRRMLPEHCARQGWTLVDLYDDAGLSGTTLERPGLQRMLADIESGLVDVVLCVDQDRLSRGSAIDQAILYDVLRRNGVKLATPQSLVDLNSEEQSLGVDIVGAVAAYERRRFLARTKRGKIERIRLGQFRAGRDPYGYRWLRDERRYEVVPHEAAVVRRIYELAAEHGVQQALWLLNREGAVTRAGKRWSRASLRRILSSRVYIGEQPVRYEDGLAPMPLPPIIERVEWSAMQRLLTARRAVARCRYDTPLLTGLLRCECGLAMWLQRERPGHGGARYRCSSSNQWKSFGLTGPCGQPSIKAESLDREVWQAVVAAVSALPRDMPAAENATSLRARIRELDSAQVDTLRLRRQGVLTPAAAETELRELALERARLESRLDAPDAVDIDPASIAQLTTVDARRQVIAALGGVRLTSDGVTVG